MMGAYMNKPKTKNEPGFFDPKSQLSDIQEVIMSFKKAYKLRNELFQKYKESLKKDRGLFVNVEKINDNLIDQGANLMKVLDELADRFKDKDEVDRFINYLRSATEIINIHNEINFNQPNENQIQRLNQKIESFKAQEIPQFQHNQINKTIAATCYFVGTIAMIAGVIFCGTGLIAVGLPLIAVGILMSAPASVYTGKLKDEHTKKQAMESFKDNLLKKY